MGLYNNIPTFSYVHATGITVTWCGELYTVQDFSTNKKYIYWTSSLPNQLNASNVMPNRSASQYLVLVNDNGIATEVPSTSEDFSIAYDGNSTQAIRDRIFGLYEKNEQFGEKFVAIEQDIDGIKQIVGNGGVGGDGYNHDAIWEKISIIEQKADEIDLSVKETVKQYNDDKETDKIREDLNSSIITINSTLGTFKGEITGYFKNNEITEEESIKISTQLEILENQKASVDGCVDTVILIAENNNQTQDVVALNSAKKALQNAHDNLVNNISNAVIDSIITPTETTIIIDSFAKYNLRINELKKTCDDIIILGLGGVLIEELANINIKSDEIKLSVSKVESDFKSDLSVQKIEFNKQINDLNVAFGNFEEAINTTFKDGIIDEAEKQLLEEKLNLVDKEKVDIDLKYDSMVEDANLSEDIRVELTNKYNEYCSKHNELKEKVNNVISDQMVNDAEKLEIDTLFKQYSNALAYCSAIITKAIENVSFNLSKAELEQAKNELKAEIDDVKESISSIGEIIDGTFEDNILDEVERKNIEQNLETLSREKIDIDNTYNDMYNSEFLTGDNKSSFKLAYDEYIDAYNEVVTVSTNILNKETLIDDIDRANLNSAVLGHKDKLNLFFIKANETMDIISTNKSNNLKEDIQQEISDVNDRIDEVLGDISGAVGDGIIDKAEAIIIKESLENIQKEKLDIDAKYTIIYGNTYLDGIAKTNLDTAKSEFDTATLELINTVTTIIEDDLVTEDEKLSLEEARSSYKEKSSILSTRFEEAIDYISVKQVDEAKEDFRKEIDELNGVVTDLEDTMNGAFQDSILTEAEKVSINQHLLTLSSEKSDIDKQYATIYANTHLEGEPKESLSTAYNNYVSSYNSLVTVINNILNKEGLIDSTDRNNLNEAFKTHDIKLGTYTTSATNALDAIAQKRSEVESEKVDKKYAEIILDPETGIQSKVGYITEKIEGDGGIEQRLQTAEQSISPEGITNIVQDIQLIKDMNGNITTNTQKITEVEQTNSSITSTVKDIQNGMEVMDSKIEQTALDIRLEVNNARDGLQASIDVNAGSITQLVKDVEGNSSAIKQNASQISSKVSNGDFQTYKTQTANLIAQKVGSDNIGSLIEQNSEAIKIGFNGINERININSRSMDFTATNGNKDMLLYNGQVCVYNNMDDTFLGTVGAVLNTTNTFKGSGFLLGKNCNDFVIGRDSSWSDILTNRSPSPTHYLHLDFANSRMNINLPLRTNSIDMRSGNLTQCNKAYTKDLYAYGWKDYSSGSSLLTYSNNRIVVGANMSFNGYQLMNPDLYTNKFQFTNGKLAFEQHYSGANVIMNNIAWDWQGWDIVSARFVGCVTSYSLIDSCKIGESIDVENDPSVLIANEDISEVDEDGNVSYDMSDMIKLLYKKINTLEKEVTSLKQELNDVKLGKVQCENK